MWKIATDGTFSVIHTIASGDSYGATPYGGLVLLKKKLYGTNNSGGSFENYSCGVVFEMDMAGNETVLHTFVGGQYNDRSSAYSGLAKGSKASYTVRHSTAARISGGARSIT